MSSIAFGFSTRSDRVTIASVPWIPPTEMLSTVTLGAARRVPRLAHATSAETTSASAAIVPAVVERLDLQRDIGVTQAVAAVDDKRQTLKRKCITSPSRTIYSFP